MIRLAGVVWGGGERRRFLTCKKATKVISLSDKGPNPRFGNQLNLLKKWPHRGLLKYFPPIDVWVSKGIPQLTLPDRYH